MQVQAGLTMQVDYNALSTVWTIRGGATLCSKDYRLHISAQTHAQACMCAH